MTRQSQTPARRIRAYATDQSGFTLIELLVAMVISLIVIGGGTAGMAEAFRSSSETSARTAATNQAEVGFEVLTRDLRQALTCPTPLNFSSGTTWNGNASTGLITLSHPGSVTLEMCDPAPGLPVSVTGSEVPQSAFVTWTCTASTELCVRQTQNISNSTVTGQGATTNTITGVQGLSLTVLAEGYGIPTQQSGLLSAYGYTPFAPLATWQFVPPSFNDQAPWLTWVGITAQIASLKTPDGPSTVQATGTAPVTLQTSVTLRNANL